MNRYLKTFPGFLTLIFSLLPLGIFAEEPENPRYEIRKEHDRNGIGKFYLGREIAHVMGHEAADWLDRPEREAEEAPSMLIAALKFQPGQVMADIGAGSGYFSFRISPLVGEKGKVLAVDIQQEMLDIMKERAAKLKITNVETILGTITDPKLPDQSVDLVLLVDVYHEFDHPYEMMAAIRKALKPEGRVALVEYRGEDPKVPIKVVHKMTEVQARKEMDAVGLKWKETIEILPRQHIMIFGKR